MTADGRLPTAAEAESGFQNTGFDEESSPSLWSVAPGRFSDGGRPSAVGGLLCLLTVGLLLLSFGLRVHRIGEQRVWWDEGWSVWAARFPVADILRETGNDVHPPLYFALLHGWRQISGDSEAGLRLLSAYLGLLTAAATYTLGRDMGRGLLPPGAARAVGLLAALLLAVSRFAIAWSQEIRMYALATLLGVLAVWAARRVWASSRRRDALAYVLAATAGLYTLYLFALIWAAINLAWLVGVLRRKDPLPNPLPQGEGTKGPLAQSEGTLPRSPAPPLPCSPTRWLVLQLLIAALFAPWALYAAGGFLSTASATPIRLLDFLHIYWTVLTVGIPVDVAQFNWLTLPALAVFLLAVVALMGRIRNYELGIRNEQGRMAGGQGRVQRSLSTDPLNTDLLNTSPLLPRSPAPLRDFSLLLTVLLLPAAVVYFISLPRQNFYNPPFNPRYLVIFTPFYSILLAWGLVVFGQWVGSLGRVDKKVRRTSESASHPVATRRQPLATTLPAAFMVAVALIGLWPYYPGRVLVDDYPSLVSTITAHRQPGDAVVLYTDTDWPIFAFHHPGPWRGVPHLWAMTPELVDDFLSPVWESHDAVWLVTTPYSAGGDPQRHVPAWLAERAGAVREFAYKDMALTLYARTAERAATADTLVNGPPPSRQLDISLALTGAITGYSQAARDFKSGDVIHLFLYAGAPDGVEATVGLLDEAGTLWAETVVPLPAAAETTRQQIDLLVPPEAPSGRYRFAVRDATGQPAPFGALTIRQRQTELLTEADVTITNPLDVAFDGGVRLLGYDLRGAARPGETLALTLYWSAGGPLPGRYKVFSHLLGETFNAANGNFLWGQSDAEPAANTRPTTGWRAGEVIVDEHAIPIAADAPPGAYRIEVGLYEPVSGARLAVVGADGAVVGDHVIVTPIELTP